MAAQAAAAAAPLDPAPGRTAVGDTVGRCFGHGKSADLLFDPGAGTGWTTDGAGRTHQLFKGLAAGLADIFKNRHFYAP
jgi:hypothetical protein